MERNAEGLEALSVFRKGGKDGLIRWAHDSRRPLMVDRLTDPDALEECDPTVATHGLLVTGGRLVIGPLSQPMVMHPPPEGAPVSYDLEVHVKFRRPDRMVFAVHWRQSLHSGFAVPLKEKEG